MKNLILFFATVLIILGQACSPSNPKNKAEVNVLSNISLEKEPKKDRKLTKEANISIETKNFKNTCLAIRNLIIKYHGQINVESDNTRGSKELEAEFEARIPAQSFDLLLKEMESVDGKIVDKTIKIEDITANYLDVETRLKAKKELEARYIQLLAKATKVTEMLEIEKQLNDQREEIESMEGRFKFMQHEVENNLLHITVSEARIGSSGFFGKTLHALSQGWTIFMDFIIVLLTLWPFIIVGGAIWYFIRKYMKHDKKKHGLER